MEKENLSQRGKSVIPGLDGDFQSRDDNRDQTRKRIKITEAQTLVKLLFDPGKPKVLLYPFIKYNNSYTSIFSTLLGNSTRLTFERSILLVMFLK